MNLWHLLATATLFTALSACATPPGATSSATNTTAKNPVAAAGTLPCAESGDAAALRYGVESLYRGGAALPTASGLVCLDALANRLKSAPQRRWQVTVSGEEGYGFDALALAAKRQELLQRFLTRQGVALQGWEWQTVVTQGVQLELTPLKAGP